MKTVLALTAALVSLAWGWDVLVVGTPPGATLWVIRQEALYLTGLLSIALMSLAMFLSTRPAWLEGPLGGLDRVYRTHRWAGILAGVFALTHWLVEMSGDLIKALIGRSGRIPKETLGGFLEALRHLAKDLGEWAIWVLLAMLLITLWRRFPYAIWRVLHRVMPLLYLALALHAVMLAPPAYWTQPAGVVLAALIAAGVYGSVLSLAGRIGRSLQVTGKIVSVSRISPEVVGVSCQLDERWPGHRPGQFAFVRFAHGDGQHPFTIASADHGNRQVRFEIKALGDFTRRLGERLAAGQPVSVEGPYGRFELRRRKPGARQIWIAGGIGVTPFLAWLESLTDRPAEAPAADLHYCTRDGDADPFVDRLQSLCAALPQIRLSIHDARAGQTLTAGELAASEPTARSAEVWFCGPQGLADALRAGLARAWRGRLRFHQEAFALR
ncbi:ferric reductase-like transmembrane domain-containing protein [Accumulibacter sp.]|uniref:ferredoxin reductase family protein n=1 Tax=Accumulibacter sp. TaxID=2053492 RepID=UPI0025D5A9C2|nr:ferric reductase-like transmembrane domain-containing protein [Accumulibacter sp.]MCM8596997.1 ferric reductase-like transmembrane domain-containing protein [Accumulibacter sp.]MCM8626257.1 ferric reductase-like transmembrane domain-containing protein [Accumulibacter sp.]MDS4051146.1 ferric reductase-like transmembrane domain-containing protein [Accumulibacter sp.]